MNIQVTDKTFSFYKVIDSRKVFVMTDSLL